MGFFMFSTIVGLAALGTFGKKGSGGDSLAPSELTPAMYWKPSGEKTVRCELCPNACVLADGQIGQCKARKNIGGKLYSMVFGRVSSVHLDPIEKKPLYHFLPGSQAYSYGTTGCNLRCKFCQNWQISQVFPWEVPTRAMTPAQIVEEARLAGARSIAYTYNEPIISYEFTLETAKLAHRSGLKNVMISSGFINPGPLEELLHYLDAFKVDLKGFDERFYGHLTAASLSPVLANLKIIRKAGVWLEIVNLVIPGENDSDEDFTNLTRWIKENLGTEVPLHFTRFHPDYKLVNSPPTPIETLTRARAIAMRQGLKYVYTGNVPDPGGSATLDPATGETVIERRGFFVEKNLIGKNGRAPSGSKIAGVFE
ncbi:MAG: AmmeMemoRadiSam system radical SAM enzyme [Candidatus Omnitrophota bacterium]